MVVIFLIFALLVSSPAVAHEASLIDILAAKGILSKKEVQRLKKGTTAKTGEYDQQALIGLLRKKVSLKMQTWRDFSRQQLQRWLQHRL